MAPAPQQQRLVGRILVVTAAVMFGLAIAFWNGLGGLSPDVRTLVATAVAVAGLVDLGMGIVFLRRAQQ